MEVIPVIDLLDGQVVHAKKGQRQLYQPIQSKICQSSEPIAICKALLELYPFQTLYIADLNAIQKQTHHLANHFDTIQSIQLTFPNLSIWLDAGISNIADWSVWRDCPYTLVLGSENFATLAPFLSLKAELSDFILSLDFFEDGFHGASALLANTCYWPTRVIAMSLPNVGASNGPNTALHHQIQQQSPFTQLIASGGIRGEADLISLKNANISGVLIASALHSGALTSQQLMANNQQKAHLFI